MPRLGLHGVLDWLRRRVLADVSCGELVQQFVANSNRPSWGASKAEDSFAELVRRHGPKVYGICRRILGDHQLAEDAFQATFVVLSKKAGAIHPPSAVGGFLYGVARKAALKALPMSHRRKEKLSSHMPNAASPDAASHDFDSLAMLDEEIANLSNAHRAAVVLCEIDGVSRSQAAKQLGIAEGTLSSRLAAARKQLRNRLLRRGVSLSSGMLVALADSAHAVVPLGLTVSASKMTPTALAPAVSLIVQGVLKTMLLAKLKTAATVGVAVCLASSLAMGVVATHNGLATTQAKSETIAMEPAALPQQIDPIRKEKPRTDLYGDPLPNGAIARLGTIQLRHARMSDFVFQDGGKSLLTAGGDRVLRIWDVATGQERRTVPLQGSAGPGQRNALSPDGKYFAAHDSGTLTIWDVQTGAQLKSLASPKSTISYLRFSPDGKTLAVGEHRYNTYLVDWQSGAARDIKLPTNKRADFYGTADSTYYGSFSPDGHWFVAAGSWMLPLTVFETATGREVLRIECGPLRSAISPDGKCLVVSTFRGDLPKREFLLRFFEFPSGKPIADFLQDREVSRPIVFSPDSKTLACGAGDRGVLIECETGRVLQYLPESWEMAFAPDGKSLAVRNGYRLNIWDFTTEKQQFNRPGDLSGYANAVSPDGKIVAEADWYARAITLWDAWSGRLVRRIPLNGEDEWGILNLIFSADSRTLLAGQSRGFLKSWNVANGELQSAVQLREANKPNSLGFLRFHMASDRRHVSTMERSSLSSGPGGPSSEATRLGRWDLGTGQLLWQETFPGERRGVVWSADGLTVAIVMDGAVHTIDATTSAIRFRTPDVTSNWVKSSPDDRLLAAQIRRGNEDLVGVWEFATGSLVAHLPTGPVTHLVLAADNRTVVTTNSRFLTLWDLATGKERRRWTLPVAGIDSWGRFSLLLSADGRRAFTFLADSSALVWDLSDAPKIEPLIKQATQNDILMWWADLRDQNAARAYAAVWRLAETPDEVLVRFLQAHMKPAVEADAKMVRQLIVDLDNSAFKVRDNAYQKLEELDKTAVPTLRDALAKKLGLEVQRRLEALLSRAHDLASTPEPLRRLRALQVLERLDSQESRRLLSELAKGMSQADETVEALRSLDRLAQRNVTR